MQAMKKDSAVKLAVPAAVLPFLAPVAAFAAEGTGRVSNTSLLSAHVCTVAYETLSFQAFGIDDGRLIWAALAPSFIIFPLYLQWASQQDGDDFFDGYEKRRSG